MNGRIITKIHTLDPLLRTDGTVTMPLAEWRCPHGCPSGQLAAADPKRHVAERLLEDLVEEHEQAMHGPEIKYREMLVMFRRPPMFNPHKWRIVGNLPPSVKPQVQPLF